MDLQTLTLFGGLSAVAIVYYLTQRARRAKLIDSPRASFLFPGAVWLILTVLLAWQEGLSQPLWVYLLVWLGGWVATMGYKAAMKDGERKE